MYNKLFDNFIKKTLDDDLNILYAQMHKDGKLVSEYSAMNAKVRLNIMSISKSFVSCAFGIAEKEGLISRDTKLIDIFPEYKNKNIDRNIYDITMEDLLTMRSGQKDKLFFNESPERYVVKDWIDYFFNQEFTGDKNNWLYSNFCTYMVSCCIERVSGANLLEYLRYRFFEKIGITNPDWTLCPQGHVHAANGLYLTIDELSKFGELLRNYGYVNGEEVVPAEYLKLATSKLVDNSDCYDNKRIYRAKGYGYQFHINPESDSFHCAGKYGQFVVVAEQKGVVISVISFEEKYGEIGNNLYKEVIEKL